MRGDERKNQLLTSLLSDYNYKYNLALTKTSKTPQNQYMSDLEVYGRKMGKIKKKCHKCYVVSEFPVEMKKDRQIVCPYCKDETSLSNWLDWEESSSKSMRFNKDKLRFDLIPPEADKMLAEILTMGARKYSDRNWEKGSFKLVEDIIGSLKRHLNDWELGVDNDEDSGQNHTKHILWNAMALAVYVERGLGVDDRRKSDE